MEPRIIAGLTISTEGPFVNLSFISENTNFEYMLPVSSIGPIKLQYENRPDPDPDHERPATNNVWLEVHVDGRLFLRARTNPYRSGHERWFRGSDDNHGLEGMDIYSDDAVAIRNALRSAYLDAGNFRRG